MELPVEGLVEIRPQRRIDEIEIGSENPVAVETLDLVERFENLVLQRGDPGRAPAPAPFRRELRLEKRHEPGRDGGMGDERGGDVALSEGQAELAQAAPVGPQHDDPAPVEPRGDRKAVEGIVLDLPVPERRKQVLDQRLDLGERKPAVAHALQKEVVDAAAAFALQLIGVLADDLEPQILELGQHLGERNDPVGVVDLEMQKAPVVEFAPVEVEGDPLPAGQLLQLDDVEDRLARLEVLLVGPREDPAVAVEELQPPLLAEALDEKLAQILRPALDDLGDAPVDLVGIGLLHLAGPRADDEMPVREHGIRQLAVIHRQLAPEGLAQDPRDLLAQARVVGFARHVDERGDEALEAVAADEGARARPLAQMQDAEGGGEQRILLDLEDLVAREGLEDVGERLAGVAARIETGAPADVLDLAPEQRHGEHAGRIGLGGEQADEAPLAHHRALLVVDLHPDVVHVDRPVDRRLDVRLGDDHRLVRAAQEVPDLLGEHGEPLRAAQHVAPGIAQQPEPRAAHRREGRHARIALETVLAVAEEGEVVVSEPAQEADRLLLHVGGDRRRRHGQRGDRLVDLRQHRPPVVHRLADIGQDRLHPARDRRQHPGIGLGVDLDVDVGFAQAAGVRIAVVAAGADDALAVAVRVAGDEQNGVVDRMDLVMVDRHQPAGDGIDEEGHVVIDDGDRRVGRRPAAVIQLARVEDAHDRPARPALAAQLPHEAGDGVEMLDRLVLDVVGGRMGVEDVEEAQQVVAFLRRGDGAGVGQNLRDLAVLEGEGIAQSHIHGGRILCAGGPGRRCPGRRFGYRKRVLT
ncbi:MAG: hypothetical protein KatS3mg119_0326 [Rhodothalassiaceae bacterium]|nr:MAG: hypothetical protein KatS3mg119_0326 [Rhodothalassiaceae bacterium]